MKVSVIIVSYNVYPFLDNCLRSVIQSLQHIDSEIIVIDNASVDRTPQLIAQHFPEVILIANTENTGFAKANNQGISIAKGEYILLLNPDTIVSENTISTCITFMDQHPEAGATGVRMLDGSGRFLPESKRGLPTLISSCMKMTGLYRLFPKSKTWNRYYQGHIGEKEIASIEVLTGAFMCIRKTTLDQVGWLDEDFFMYGEDIDLSYRITKGGYTIYYLPITDIVHYKGESTKKASLNYILTFYNAMLIFTEKHPELRGQQVLIRSAIYLHGVWQLLKQKFQQIGPVVIDFILLSISFTGLSFFWARFFYNKIDYFHTAFYYFNIPLYSTIAICLMFFQGAYDRPYQPRKIWLGWLYGIIAILVVYAFLPASFRTSRMVIVLGAVGFALLLWLKGSLRKSHDKNALIPTGTQMRKAIIVGGPAEADRIRELINRSRDQIEIAGIVSPDTQSEIKSANELGDIRQLDEIIRVHQIREIIFSAQDVPFSIFTRTMSTFGAELRYMLAASTTMNIVGSMNRDTEGESYGLRIDFNLSHPSSIRSKRMLDLLVSFCMLLVYPVLIFVIPSPLHFLQHIFQVISGKKTWVGYHAGDPTSISLPPLREGVLFPSAHSDSIDQGRKLQHIHYVYARDYHWTTDIQILLNRWKEWGQKQ